MLLQKLFELILVLFHLLFQQLLLLFLEPLFVRRRLRVKYLLEYFDLLVQGFEFVVKLAVLPSLLHFVDGVSDMHW